MAVSEGEVKLHELARAAARQVGALLVAFHADCLSSGEALVDAELRHGLMRVRVQRRIDVRVGLHIDEVARQLREAFLAELMRGMRMRAETPRPAPTLTQFSQMIPPHLRGWPSPAPKPQAKPEAQEFTLDQVRNMIGNAVARSRARRAAA